MSKNLFLLWLCTIIFAVQANAQPFFQLSSVTETMIPGISGSGAHIFDVTCNSYQSADFPDFNSDLYVSTWYDADYGLHWKRTRAGNPSIVIDEGVLAPSIGGRVHGAAIIFNPIPGSAYQYGIAVVSSDFWGGYISFYEWTVTGPSLIFSQTITLLGSNYIKRMSIDAHKLYCYSVVWEEADGDMYTLGGWTDQATTPIVGPTKPLLCTSLLGTHGFRPDVAMNHGGSFGALQTIYAYVKNSDIIVVSKTSFSDLVNPFIPTITPTIADELESHIYFTTLGATSSTPGFTYSIPKLDAPEHSGDYWAVVASDVYIDVPNSIFHSYIRTAYDVNSVQNQVTLNDGVSLLSAPEPLFDGGSYSGLYPTIPAVAFHHDGNQLHYAWGKTIDHIELGNHDYVGMMFDPVNVDAIPGSSGEGYRIIDLNPNYEPLNRAIALTGQDEASNDFYIVFTADDLAYPPFTYMECLYAKHVDWNNIPAIGYRGENNNPGELNCSENLILNYYPNPVIDKGLNLVLNDIYITDDIEINIYDITGRKLHNHKGNIEEINLYLSDITTNAAKGLWTVQVISHTSGKSESIRVSVQ